MPKHRGGRRRDSEDAPWSKHGTSQDAASHMDKLSGQQRIKVFNCIRAAGARGCTREEVQKELNLRPNSVTPRFWELEGDGLIKPNGKERQNESGRWAEVYVVAETPAEVNSLGVRL